MSTTQLEEVEEVICTHLDVEIAWKAHLAAVDAWEDSNYDEALREDMALALAFAKKVESQYHDQYRRTVYREDGTQYIIPRIAEALIKGHWYKVKVMLVINTRSFWAVQVQALPIDGWQPRPFGVGFGMGFGMDNVDTGSVPLENVRVNGKRLGAE